MEKETRVFENEIEVRKADDGTEYITGYAVVFNSESRDLGGFKEVILPEAFRNTDMSDVVALFNHDYNLILGRTPQTLTLSVDQHGVRYKIVPPPTTMANDLKESIRRGDVRGSSFGFSISENGDTWEKPPERGGIYKRTVKAIARLFDVSPVVNPAYVSTDTSIAKRALGMEKDKDEQEMSDALQIEKDLAEAKLKREQNWMRGFLNLHNNFEYKIADEEKRRKDKIQKETLRMKREQYRFKSNDLTDK